MEFSVEWTTSVRTYRAKFGAIESANEFFYKNVLSPKTISARISLDDELLAACKKAPDGGFTVTYTDHALSIKIGWPLMKASKVSTGRANRIIQHGR